MIRVENLSKSFGARKLFDEVNFSVGRRERLGLVGRNGHGKTTLFRMILGEDHPDTGAIIIPRDYRIGHVSQKLHFTRGTIIDQCMDGLPSHRVDERWYAEKILTGLGFSKNDLNRSPDEFSGGYQIRLNLASVLVAEPDMLFLDEPTNYLDLIAIRWLERFINEWKGEAIIITHDRSFMDTVTTHTLAIHRKKIRKVSGTTEKMYEQIIREEEIHEKTRLNDEKKRKEVEQFITRFRAKARLAGMVQSRVKALQKKDRLQALDKIDTLDFSFNESPFNARTILTAHGISFSYDGTGELFRDFSLTVGKGDRICIIGKNGRGKSTLLKTLAGLLKPATGEILLHQNTSMGYFGQTNVASLNEKNTIEEELMSCGVIREQARNIAGTMMFEGDEAEKKIAVLSGGEKNRVQLGKVLATPANILLLDEPTNHLDMESCDTMLSAIDNFSGAVILVTHNEMFLDTLGEKLIVFQGDAPFIFDGTYRDFLDRVGWDDEDDRVKSVETPRETVNPKESRKLRAALQNERNARLGPLDKKIAEIESRIEKGETAKNDLNSQCIEASSSGNGAKIQRLSRELHQTTKETDTLYLDYENLMAERDRVARDFESRLALLDQA